MGTQATYDKLADISPCPSCDGRGSLPPYKRGSNISRLCKVCNGAGKVDRPTKDMLALEYRTIQEILREALWQEKRKMT